MRKSPGFTIVELLVVIAIIGLLIALLMPALGAAREASRQANCQNSLKNMGTGVQQHVSTLGRYPTGGWAPRSTNLGGWMGDADQGTGIEQPGGWIYNLLPYVDQQQTHDLGAGTSTTSNTTTVSPGSGITIPSREGAYAFRMMLPMPLFNCPSRRTAKLYPLYSPSGTAQVPACMAAGTVTAAGYSPIPGVSAQPVTGVAKSDFAINRGDGIWEITACDVANGPNVSGAQGGTMVGVLISTVVSSTFVKSPSNWSIQVPGPGLGGYTGVCFQQSMVQPAHITDGAQYTILVGEKSMNPDHYQDGMDLCDQRNMYVGFSCDLNRATSFAGVYVPPVPDIPGYPTGSSPCGFGSPHPNGTNFLFCDSHVQVIRYGISPSLFASLGNRLDSTQLSGPVIDDSLLK